MYRVTIFEKEGRWEKEEYTKDSMNDAIVFAIVRLQQLGMYSATISPGSSVTQNSVQIIDILEENIRMSVCAFIKVIND